MNVPRIVRDTGVGLALAGLLAVPARAGERRPDAALKRDVEKAVLGYVYYGVFDAVAVGVADGVVVLRGSVRDPDRRQDIEARVARVQGVRELRNEISVQPASLHDDRLRAELYRRIYGNDLFSSHAGRLDPPVRILVERGHVTLAGTVASEVERAVLGAIARGTLAFSVDNQIQLESERRGELSSTSG